jgi:hypothetical protein
MAFNLEAILKFKDQSKRGRKEAERGFADLGDAVKKAGLAMVAAFGAQQVFQMAKLGAQAERVEKRFGLFAASAGGAEKVLQAFQAGAGGAASKMEAMQSASTLLQMGLASNAGEMENLVTMASRLGDQTQSVTDRVENFSLLLANQSLPRLDSFGISSGKVRSRIQELQAATEGLTREQAFMQAVMEEGNKSLDVLGERTEDNLTSFEQLEARMADLGVEIGQTLLPAITLLVGGFVDLLNAAKPVLDIFSDLSKTPPPWSAHQEGIEGANAAMATWADANVKGAQAALFMADKTNAAIEEMTAFNVLGLRISKTWGSDVPKIQNAVAENVQKTARVMSSSYGEYLEIIDTYNSQMTVAGFNVSALTEAQFNNFAAANKQAEAIKESAARYDEANKAAMENVRLTRGIAEAYDFNSRMLQEVKLAHEDGIIASEEYRLSQEAIAPMIRNDTTPALDGAARAARFLADNEAAAAEKAGLLAAKAAELAAAEALARDAANRSAEAYGNLAISLKDATEKEIARTLIGMLDPEQMGAADFIAGATEIGTSFGLMDEKSVALAENLPKIAEAMNDGVIPAQDFDTVLKDLVTDAADGDVNLGNILGKFRDLPEPIGSVAEKAGFLDDNLVNMIDTTDHTTDSIATMGGTAERIAGQVDTLSGRLEEMAGTYDIIINIKTHGEIPRNIPHPDFLHGGIVPGPIGAPRRITAHGGEIVLNPFQPGALGGPPVTNNNQRFNDTFNIFNPLAGKMALAQRRNRRRQRFEAGM